MWSNCHSWAWYHIVSSRSPNTVGTQRTFLYKNCIPFQVADAASSSLTGYSTADPRLTCTRMTSDASVRVWYRRRGGWMSAATSLTPRTTRWCSPTTSPWPGGTRRSLRCIKCWLKMVVYTKRGWDGRGQVCVMHATLVRLRVRLHYVTKPCDIGYMTVWSLLIMG